MDNKKLLPEEIEKKSFSIIEEEIGSKILLPEYSSIIKRVIHTTADFDYIDTLTFKGDPVGAAHSAFKEGATIVTDTNMALSGINKTALAALNSKAVCYIADEDVAKTAKEQGQTRASVSMEKSAFIKGPVIYAIGNAPTALMRLCQMMEEGRLSPALIIGVPVGFVNVVESKEEVLECDVPAIVAKGRKGGSNVAAAICNALMYMLTRGDKA